MKIYHIINSLNLGGAERLVVDLCKELAEYPDCKLHLILLQNSSTSLKKEIESNEKIIISTLNVTNLYDLRIPFLLSKKIENADIVHLHLFPTLYWGILYKLFFAPKKTKFIYTEHSTENNRRKKWYLKLIEKIVYQNLDHITCISQSTKLNLVEHLKIEKDENISVINNGVDLHKFKISEPANREIFGYDKRDFILIQIASFRKAKDQPTLIRALAKLPMQFKLLFIGDGPELENCIKLVSEIKESNRVNFLGKRSDIPELLKMSDIAIVSSNYEGFGIAAVEGMACKKPVICSNVAGLSEVVKKAGLLFEKGNENKLAEIILKLYSDNNFYKEISELCLNRSKHFSIKEITKLYYNIYQQQ